MYIYYGKHVFQSKFDSFLNILIHFCREWAFLKFAIFFRLNKHLMLLNMSKNVKPITKKPVGLICKIFLLQEKLLFAPQDLKINVNEALKQVKTRNKFVNLSMKQVRFRDYRFRIKKKN